MSKKQHRRPGRIIGQTQATTHSPELQQSLVAQAMSEIAPMVRSMHIDPVASLILVFIRTACVLTGDEQISTSLEEIAIGCRSIMADWLAGLLAVPSNYPYTFKETLQAWDKEERS
jgi:hypothetical protein